MIDKRIVNWRVTLPSKVHVWFRRHGDNWKREKIKGKSVWTAVTCLSDRVTTWRRDSGFCHTGTLWSPWLSPTPQTRILCYRTVVGGDRVRNELLARPLYWLCGFFHHQSPGPHSRPARTQHINPSATEEGGDMSVHQVRGPQHSLYIGFYLVSYTVQCHCEMMSPHRSAVGLRFLALPGRGRRGFNLLLQKELLPRVP